MNTQMSADLVRYEEALLRRDAASKDLYETELTLHAAHQSGVDEWVRAASEHLHRALLALELAEADVEVAARIWAGGPAAARPDRELCPVPVRR